MLTDLKKKDFVLITTKPLQGEDDGNGDHHFGECDRRKWQPEHFARARQSGRGNRDGEVIKPAKPNEDAEEDGEKANPFPFHGEALHITRGIDVKKDADHHLANGEKQRRIREDQSRRAGCDDVIGGKDRPGEEIKDDAKGDVEDEHQDALISRPIVPDVADQNRHVDEQAESETEDREDHIRSPHAAEIVPVRHDLDHQIVKEIDEDAERGKASREDFVAVFFEKRGEAIHSV